MIGRIYAIAINTFREAVRDKVLHGVLGFGCLVLLFGLALGELSLNQEQRVVTDVGLASISLLSVVVAIFLGSSLLYKEIERKTLYVILPKPIHRWEFLVGKYLGIALTGLVFILVMGAVQLLVMAVQGGVSPSVAIGVAAGLAVGFAATLWWVRDRTAAVLPWAAIALGVAAFVASSPDVPVVQVLAALTLHVGEVLVLAAVALLFSSFSTPFLTGAFTFGVWLVGRSADSLVTVLQDTALIGPEVKGVLRGVAEVAPNFVLFVPGIHTLSDASAHGGPGAYVASAMGYALAYSAVLLGVAAFVFRKRDFL